MVEYGIDWKSELQNEVVAELGPMKIYTKNINLYGGPSVVGKTITCLNFAADAIKKKNKVFFIDTESKPAVERPEPNLLKMLSNENPEGFKKYFIYERTFNPEKLPEMLDAVKPKLLIIDSIYAPYIDVGSPHRIENPYARSNAISEFISKLRTWIRERKIGTIVTTQTGRDDDDLKGGRGIFYLTDSKLYIKFPANKKKGGKLTDMRLYEVDKQVCYVAKLSHGGKIEILPVAQKIPKVDENEKKD